MSEQLDGNSGANFGQVPNRKMTTCHMCRTRRMCTYASLDFREGVGGWEAYNAWVCHQCIEGFRASDVVVLDWGQLTLDTEQQLRRTMVHG